MYNIIYINQIETCFVSKLFIVLFIYLFICVFYFNCIYFYSDSKALKILFKLQSGYFFLIVFYRNKIDFFP